MNVVLQISTLLCLCIDPGKLYLLLVHYPVLYFVRFILFYIHIYLYLQWNITNVYLSIIFPLLTGNEEGQCLSIDNCEIEDESALDPSVLDENLRAPDGTQWIDITETVNQNTMGRINAQNILTEIPGPSSHAKRNIVEGNMLSAFSLFIDDFIIKEIIKCTEAEAQNKLNKPSWKVTKKEIYCMLAIMYGRGIIAKGQPLSFLWDSTWGAPFFRNTMPRDRFKEILRFIRFDLRSIRSERIKSDKFALFSTIWDRFISNCQACYKPNSDITIDEQLFPTKSRYPFTQYMASKPDKFGIKFWLAVDSTSHYLLNGFPYLGKNDHRPQNQRLSEYVVMNLSAPFLGKGRNITCDNFFTSVNLAQMLKAKRTSIVGTVNRIRREIPRTIKTKKQPLYSSCFLKSDDMLLTVYQGKPSKNVLVLSTVHRTAEVTDDRKKLPEPVKYYNATKSGVDNIDQMARLYSTKVSCRRWPLQVFYNVLDLAVVNSVIVYREVTGTRISRREFLLNLMKELGNCNDVEDCNEDHDGYEDVSSSKKRKTCQIHTCKKNKTNDTCFKCKKYVCGKCTQSTQKRVICKLCT